MTPTSIRLNIRAAMVALAVFISQPMAALLADTIYENFSVFDSRQVYDNEWIAGTFVTDGSTAGDYALTVSKSMVGLTAYSPAFTQDADTFFAALYANSGADQPGSLLASLSGDIDPDDPGEAYYDYTGNATLTAGTRYWVVLGTTSPDAGNLHDYQVEFGNGPDTVGASGLGLLASHNQGGSWDADVVGTGPNARLTMSISVAPVPEPSSLIVAGCGLVGLIFAARWKRSA